MDFARSGFAQFMASGAGRWLRIAAGIGLIAIGSAWSGAVTGWIAAAIGLIPLGAGRFDVCILSPLFGGPLSGGESRRTH